MTSRSKHPKRREPESDSMEALKPLVVLVLFGTILYGAYTVVQKGPSSAETSATTTAPPFVPGTAATPPQVEVVPPAAPAVPVAPAAPAAATVASSAPMPPAPVPHPAGSPPAAMPPAAGGTVPPAAAPAIAAGAAAAPAPTYLEAVSAAPPVADQVPARPADSAARPDRYAALSTSTVPPAALPPSMPPAASAVKSPAMSAAFTSAWADAHDKLSAGRYAEALTALSVWYDDPSLGLEESQRLEDLLGQLAGTVIYSQQDLLQPPHVVAPGETLPAIAAPLGVPWQLLGKINGIGDPAQLVPGEHLKVLRGPFDGVVSISRRRLGLQLAGSYAGSFPAVVGREFLARVGASLAVVDIRRGTAGPNPGRRGIVLTDGMVIESVDDPSTVTDNAPATSLVISERDLDDLIDILGPGSRVLVRQ